MELPKKDKLTVAIPIGHSAKRFPSLRDHLSKQSQSLSCLVEEVVFIWNNDEEVSSFTLGLPYRIIHNSSKHSLNDRFKNYNYKTEAVLHVDDDVFFTAAQLRIAFQSWKTEPDKIYFAVGRSLVFNKNLWMITNETQPSFFGMTMFLLTHTKYMDKYWSNEDLAKYIRNKVDHFHNAEDLGFCILVGFSHEKFANVLLDIELNINEDEQEYALHKKNSTLNTEIYSLI